MKYTELLITDPNDDPRTAVAHALHTARDVPGAEITPPDSMIDDITQHLVEADGAAVVNSDGDEEYTIILTHTGSEDDLARAIDEYDPDRVISTIILPRTLRDAITNHGALVTTPTRVVMPRTMGTRVLKQSAEWRTHDCPDDHQDAEAQDDHGEAEDLPDSTEWIDGEPAPAAGQEHEGRPPIGYTTSDGALRPTDEYDLVRGYLVAADDDRTTTSNAARRIDASETSVKRILHDPERRRRYALDVRVDADQ